MRYLVFISLIFYFTCSLQAQRDLGYRAWQKVVYDQPASWYGTEEAIRIAENVLLYQREIGGWPKNTPMHLPLSKQEKKSLRKLQSTGDGATTDNGATISELTYLSKVYKATGIEAYKTSFLKGIDYLIEAQYPNGGWPQFYPLRDDYSRHITYNDGSMVNIMRVMKAISEQNDAYIIVEEEAILKRVREAYEKGVRVEFYQTEEGLRDKRVVEDANAPALWARFSELTDNRPFFCDRDGIKKYSMAEISQERRIGYGWYSDEPRNVLNAYEEWKFKNL